MASAVVLTSAVTLRAQQVDQGADVGGGDNGGAVDAGGAETGGQAGQGGGINGGQGFGGGGRGGRGGRGGGGAGGFGGQQGQQGAQGQQGQGGGGRGGRGGRQAQQGQQGQGQTGQQGLGQQGQLGGVQPFGAQQLGGAQIGGGAQQFNPSTRNLMAIQVAISSPDNEWEILQPLVQALLDAQTIGSTTVPRGFGGGGPGGGRGGRGGQQQGTQGFGNAPTIDPTTNPVAAAELDLETALQDPNSSDELLHIKLKALRDAKTKAKSLLAKAQDELREYLTLRQEAILIQTGYLE